MFGKIPCLNPLESRKQLLLAESELNRARMADDIAAMAAGTRALADRVRTYGSLASSAALLAAGLTAFRRGKPVGGGPKRSRWQAVLKGAGLISTLWFAFRSRGRDQKDQETHSPR